MVQKKYNWDEGADIGEHSKKKHSILRNYFHQYLVTRCSTTPQQGHFRLAVIDGFCGGGVYQGGELGSPIVLVQTLIAATKFINNHRQQKGFRKIEIECRLIFNDDNQAAIDSLKKSIAPYLFQAEDEVANLKLILKYHNNKFEYLYPKLRSYLQEKGTLNVFFNLDQYGYSAVTSETIRDITARWRSAEVILTFSIESALAYLTKKNEFANLSRDPQLQKKVKEILIEEKQITKKEWLGTAEQAIYEHLGLCANFVSPFSINNPSGWRYWLMHFANNYRARQVYNDLLHQDSRSQAHFGRSGLNMLSYDPNTDNTQLYLFDDNSRSDAKKALYDDIPNLVAQAGDALPMEDFYTSIYSGTPAHSDDIHNMIIENPDLEVITPSGGERRKANTISVRDTLKLRNQKSFFSFFND